MRLLYFDSAHAICWKQFGSDEIPPYAILSHRWESAEVSFMDLGSDAGRDKAGYQKIVFCGEQAARDGLRYFWVDTCCIDKRDLHELSKAINSMYRWHSNAVKCYVYLSDVSADKVSFKRSRWFTRGWTLQELIAPSSVEFFSKDCRRLGDRQSLEQTIHEVTGIPIEVLQGCSPDKFSVVDRMQWASSRQTTEEEDGAYCLLGIFDVFLPLIYGEGKANALARLQKEIEERQRRKDRRAVQIAGKLDYDESFTRIRQWLSPLDPSSNYRQALKQRQDGTGQWFLQSQVYTQWTNGTSASLWLYGMPGSGKSILSATIIEDINEMLEKEANGIAVYFYFVFSDVQKRAPEMMVRSVVSQLLSRYDSVPIALENLYVSCDKGQRQTTLDASLDVLRQMILGLPHVFLILDALDECNDREQLMDVLSAMASWKLTNLQMLFTSRKERDIESTMLDLVERRNTISLESELVKKDIELYVQNYLAQAKELQKWRKDAEIQTKIEKTLTRGAHGMFRWVACQLEALKKCRNRAMLVKALGSLPSTLDSTYERILLSISEEDSVYAIRILRWLAFSARPLLLDEIAEIAAIEPSRGASAFNKDEALADPSDVCDICSSIVLVTTMSSDEVYGAYSRNRRRTTECQVLVLAHYSVQEFLVSERCLRGPASRFAAMHSDTQGFIASSCLNYLLQFDNIDIVHDDILTQYKLATYAAEHWISHAQEATGHGEVIERSTVLLSRQSKAFASWIRLHNPDQPREGVKADRDVMKMPVPLYYACQGGLFEVVDALIVGGADVNAQGGLYGNALQVAANGGHNKIVELLVAKGANVNAHGGLYGNALQAAVYRGHYRMAELLITKGADINAQSGLYSNALQTAIFRGHSKIVELLIANGADINAIQTAAYKGHYKMAEMLIINGADINAQGGKYGNALQAAIYGGHHKIVELLITKGADVNAQGGRCHTALHAAALRANLSIINLLLNHGAKYNLADLHGWTIQDIISYNGLTGIKEILARSHVDLTKSESAFSKPSALVKAIDSSTVLISGGGLILSTENTTPRELSSKVQVRSNHPIAPDSEAYYEVQILRGSPGSEIGVGFCTEFSSSIGMPGWHEGSWGYHGDDGQLFTEHWAGTAYGPVYEAGDVIGCGFNFRTNELFFMKNSHHLGVALKLPRVRLFAAIGVGDRDVVVLINFKAQRPDFQVGDHNAGRVDRSLLSS